ncbi:MAG: PQQ-binding-like beta-propeller repeat protein [Bryobacteraceae bacterium]
MIYPTRRILYLCLALTVPAAADDWPMYLHDLAHSSLNSNESGIGLDNAGQLWPLWTLSLGHTISAAPTVVNGVLYFGDWSGYFYAVNASDGSIRWQQYVGKAADPESATCQPAIGISSQATVIGSTVYVGGGDSAVYALDITSGNINWRVPLADPASGAYLWSSIVPSGNSLYVGISSLGDCPLTQGAVVRLDLANPNQPVIRYLSAVDDPGGGVWSTPAIDESTHTVFVTTGTGTQDPGSGAWGSAFLALDATTLEIKSYFLLPTYLPDVDIEWGSSPTLLEAADGTPLVAATGKDGILYVLNRADMSLAWAAPLALGCVAPEQGCGSISTPAFDGQLLFVGAGVVDPEGFDNGSLYAIGPSTGQTLWMHTFAAPVLAPVTIANGVLYVATTAGAFAYNAQTGDLLWSDDGYGGLYSQPVVVNGTLYTSYVNGDVIAWTPPSV